MEVARGIEAERKGVYQATAEELAAIDRGLDDVRDGRLAPIEELAKVRAVRHASRRLQLESRAAAP